MRHLLTRPEINSICIGYSTELQWEFFRLVLSHSWIKKIAILGVYYARDVAYMSAIMNQFNRPDYLIVGVDKFEDSFCEDWPEEKRTLSWQEAGYGPAPELEKSRYNLAQLGLHKNVFLTPKRDADFLKTTQQVFDFIYIDTSHDYHSVKELIKLSYPKLSDRGFIGGDDYSDSETWGVASAVKDSFHKHDLYFNWLWLAQKQDFVHPDN